uniref:GP97 n=1 Tax=Caviid herpesvirus 2 str. CIDMTR TaxID=1415526 RepID=U6H9Y5_9BETA|nr:GP97 [Caviid herpesvirus 2 str. CIDMTR]
MSTSNVLKRRRDVPGDDRALEPDGSRSPKRGFLDVLLDLPGVIRRSLEGDFEGDDRGSEPSKRKIGHDPPRSLSRLEHPGPLAQTSGRAVAATRASRSSCTCTPRERSLSCSEEMIISRAGRLRYCPICNRERRVMEQRPSASAAEGSPYDNLDPAWTDDRFCQHASLSTDTMLISHIPGLECDLRIFDQLREPCLKHYMGSEGYLTVYVPKREDFCDAVCRRVDRSVADARLGIGAFGEVWPVPGTDNVVKISKRVTESIIGVWVSGVIRAKSRQKDATTTMGGRLIHGFLAAMGCCMYHKTTLYARMDVDMYRYDGWKLAGMESYRHAFSGLADALRFLNGTCHICHFDVSPMNCLIKVDPSAPYRIARAALCDYSLTEPHPMYNRRCAVVLQETKSVRMLPDSQYKLCECYHPAFRPIILQRTVCAEPDGYFPFEDWGQFCVAEICALGMVVCFCLMRTLDWRGVPTVRRVSESLLFQATPLACDAMEKQDLAGYSSACLAIMARQLAYVGAILGSRVSDTFERTKRFVKVQCGDVRYQEFTNVYEDAVRIISPFHVRDRLALASRQSAGRYLLGELVKVFSVSETEHLLCDPRTLFQADYR